MPVKKHSIRVVVIGAFGNFGARICKRLALEPEIEVVAAGRHARNSRGGSARTARLDTSAPDFPTSLRALLPDIVIHCAGPYQGQDYRVAEATLACRAHYIDLSDGREFVSRFSKTMQSTALAADCAAITGASTLPALSSAVVDHFAPSFAQIRSIEIAIAPGQHAPRGRATMAAVLSYAGKPFMWLQDGLWRKTYGWQSLKKIEFPFGTRIAAACDVPDLALFPKRYPGVRTVTFRAALEVPIQHYALWALAGLRRAHIPLTIVLWTESLDRAAGWLNRFGSDCGGMQVVIGGEAPDGSNREVTWQLIAQSNHGPEIPCMAAVLTALKIARHPASIRGSTVYGTTDPEGFRNGSRPLEDYDVN